MAASPDDTFARAPLLSSQNHILYHQEEKELVRLAELKATTLQKHYALACQEIQRLQGENQALEKGLLQVKDLKEKFENQEREARDTRAELVEKDNHISDLRIEGLHIEEKGELEVAICKLKEQLRAEEENASRRVSQIEEDQTKQIEQFKTSVEKIMGEKNEALYQKQQSIKTLLVELDTEKQKLKEVTQRSDIKEKAADNQIRNLEQLLNAKNEALGTLQRDVADLRAENAQMKSINEVEIKKRLMEFETREKQLESKLEEEMRKTELKIVEKTHHIQMESNELKSKLKMMRMELQLAKAQSERLAQFERITLEQATEDKQQNQQIVENVVKSYETQLAQRVEAFQKLQGDYQRAKLNLQIKEEEIKTLKIKVESREQELLQKQQSPQRYERKDILNEFKTDELEGLRTANQLLRKDVDRLEDKVRSRELEVDKLTGQLNATRQQLHRATGRSHPQFRQTGSSFGIKEEFDSSLHKMGREVHKNLNELLEGSGEDFFRNSAEPTLHGSPMPQRFKSMDLEAQNRELKAAVSYMEEQVMSLTSEIKEYKRRLEGTQGRSGGVSDAEATNLRLQLDEKQHELFEIQNALIQEREKVLKQESHIMELNNRNQQLSDELNKVKAQRQKLAELCSELKAELSVLRKKDDNDPEGYYSERIQRLEDTIEELEGKLRRYEMRKERYTQDDQKPELIVQGDHMSMVERGPNTPQRLHYKANSSKATASQLLTAERIKAKTKAAQTKVTQPKKKPDSSVWLGHK